MQNVQDVIGHYSGLSRIVLDYSQWMKRIVDGAKSADFSAASWDPIAKHVDTEAFVRVGNFKEVMRWDDYVGFLTNWAPHAQWECSFKRITEVGNTVFLELEERSTVSDHSSVVNSMTVYEFNSAAKLVHLDIYLQMPMPEAAMLQSYDGIKISG